MLLSSASFTTAEKEVKRRRQRKTRSIRAHFATAWPATTESYNALSSFEDTAQEPISLRFNEPETSRTGKLLNGPGKSRYIDSNLWRNLGDDEIKSMSEEDEDEQLATGFTESFASDPLTGAFMGSQQDLLQYHPAHAEAMILWNPYVKFYIFHQHSRWWRIYHDRL